MLPAVAVETEASQMLEAALEQMDDIIAGRPRRHSKERLTRTRITSPRRHL